MGSTKVSTPAPTPKSQQELDLVSAQTKQLENLTRIQEEQFKQFQEFAPAQMEAFQTQADLAKLAAEAARADRPLLEETRTAQTELLRLSREDAARRAQLEKLTLPVLLESAGQKPIFDEAGNLVSLEALPKSELELLQEQFALESTQEALKGIRGEVPVGDPFERRIAQDRTALREQLRRQLGPGFETSSPGIEALSQFEALANEARENIRFGRLSQSAALAEVGSERLNQGLLRDLEILSRERASSIPGAFGVASGTGSSASESLARAFALSGGVTQPGSDALLRSADLAGRAGAFAGDIAGGFAQDRRIIDAMNQQAAIQSAANRAARTSSIFGALGSAAGVGGGIFAASRKWT
ncbi:MAG: hypothetical protein A2093_07600 [Caulobacterales bacterium GWE1_67_11]|nr:MAG: hypothetical protein A2093_07600 [Caulobacterales bacterium GWE1_67_11]